MQDSSRVHGLESTQNVNDCLPYLSLDYEGLLALGFAYPFLQIATICILHNNA